MRGRALGLIPALVLIGQIRPAQTSTPTPKAFVTRYCVACHNPSTKAGNLTLTGLDPAQPAGHTADWERVVERLRAGSMPPPGVARPEAALYATVATAIESALDRTPPDAQPARASAVHRLNRTEYRNAVRDLLAVDVDVRSELPGDETADGSFDNFADVLSISTAHLERYLSVARQVTRLAVGLPPAQPRVDKFDIPLHVLQEDRQSEDLPLGSRGGIAVRRDFPAAGEYLIRVRLQRQYQDYLKGMGWPQQLDVRLDGKLLKRFTVGGGAKGRAAGASYAGDGEPGFAGDPEWEIYMQTGGDAHLELRAQVEAGPHVVGVSFVRELWEPEGLPQPQQRGRVITNDEVYMSHANVGSVLIGGPYKLSNTISTTPSRTAIFTCNPTVPAEQRPCAATILSRIARRAYRRPITTADMATLLTFYDQGRAAGGFDEGIQLALERILADPDFLLRIERPRPAPVLSSLELASRLSFFLWSSVPDDRLLALAEKEELRKPAVLTAEARRLLADPRAARALVEGFAAQWLNLRRVSEVVVDPIRYPNYDESLLRAFEQETELFLESTLRQDAPLPELLSASYTFVNERLANHYGIPGVTGSRFRRVTLGDLTQRGGLLAHGALLATTSYPDRTSPVLRGKWLMNNIFGAPVPLPPPGANTNLEPTSSKRPASIRERLAKHRADPKCNSCHAMIDPPGFALENFDVIGGWRTADETGNPVDTRGATAAGIEVNGLEGLRRLLLAQPEQFPRTVTAKLLAYALGRRLEYADQPEVRRIVQRAGPGRYRWSSIILGIVESPAFQRRRGS